MKVLVTGGAGFIGSWVCEVLVRRGCDVLCVDDFSRGRPENIKSFCRSMRVETMNILEPPFTKLMVHYQPDVVVHLAAIHYIPEVNQRPAASIRTNVEGVQAVCSACSLAGCQRLIVASSAAVYSTCDSPHVEDEAPLNPVDLYGLTKLWAEQLALLAVRTLGIKTVALRFFNAIGPRETNPHLIPYILENIDARHIPLGNILTQRDYTFVGDIAEVVARLCERDPKKDWEIFNVCRGIGATANDILQTLSSILRREIQADVRADRIRKVDVPYLVGSSDRLRTAIGYVPNTDLIDGLKITLRSDARFSKLL